MRFAVLLAIAACSSDPQAIEPGPDEAPAPGCADNKLYGDPPPPYRLTVGGEDILVRNGNGYRPISDRDDEGEYLGAIYDPTFVHAYALDACAIYRIAPDDPTQQFLVSKDFASTYDTATDLRSLIGEVPGYTAFTLQSPDTPTIAEYTEHRRCYLAGTCDFTDNRIDIVDGAVRFTSVAKSPTMITAKASIERQLVHFIRGDTVRFTARLWLREGTPFGVFDLESAWFPESDGIRLVIDAQGAFEVELKSRDRDRFRQTSPRTIPRDRWVTLAVEIDLQPDPSGRVRVTQDGEPIIDAGGVTLPLANTIYNSLELGITATDGAAVLDLDDIAITRLAR